MLSKISYRFGVWQARQSYIGSPAQQKFHGYIRSEQQLKETKKHIDYRTILKNSKGRLMIRQFLFQEKVEQNYVPPLNCYLLPIGKWTREEIQELGQGQARTTTELLNEDILQECGSVFEKVIGSYYAKIGKPGYKFILGEQIGKISQMSEQQFSNLVKTLGGNQKQILKEITQKQKI